ncbi:MAG: hypothetical protein KA116_03680 [Proteobacteria bacterium]|nr:hypothetical protein [Pseudomonadota bacterium]
MRRNRGFLGLLLFVLLIEFFSNKTFAGNCKAVSPYSPGFKPNVLPQKGMLYLPAKNRNRKLLVYFPGLNQSAHPTSSPKIFSNSSYKLQEVADKTGYAIFSLHNSGTSITKEEIHCLLEASESGQLDVASHSGGILGLQNSARELKKANVSNLYMLDNFYNKVNGQNTNPSWTISNVDAGVVHGFVHSTNSQIKQMAKSEKTNKGKTFYTFESEKNSAIINMGDHYDSVSKFLIGINQGTLDSNYDVDESLVQVINKGHSFVKK